MDNNYTVDNLYSTKINQFQNREFLNIEKYKIKIKELENKITPKIKLIFIKKFLY